MQKPILFIILSILLLLLTLDVWSDTIHLKNKRSLTGIIKEETDATVTIDIGIGKVTVQKSEIESIEKAGEEEKESLLKDFKKRDVERGALVPPGLEEITKRFQELKNDKNRIDIARSQFVSLKRQFAEKKEKFNSLLSTFNAKNLELKNLDPNRDVKYYNRVVSDVNSLNAKLASLADELTRMSEKYPIYGQAVQKAIITYKDNLDNFRIYFEKKLKSAKERQLTGDEISFFDTIGEALENYESNLHRESVILSKTSGNLVVEVKLNGQLTCLMAVDTGASLVTISRNIAGRLELDLGDERNEAEFLLADGSKRKGRIVTLKSIEVGNSKAEEVLAAVMDSPPGPGVDGLLGMSFLDNFSVKIDSVNNKLVLESIK